MGDGIHPLCHEGDKMHYPPQAVPEPVTKSRDPLAAALGNASLLNVGYLMLGRRKPAVVTGLITLVLLIFLASVFRTAWFEFVVVLWWVALIAHAWFLAGRGAQRVVLRNQRLTAAGITAVVLLVVGFLRLDAAGIERTVTDARASGDCDRALTALDEVAFGHRVADAPLVVRGERTVEACHRLRTAKDALATGLTPDTRALKAGFDGLTSVLADLPGHEKMVDVVLDRFLAALPAKNPCTTVVITDWLRQRQVSNNAMDRAAVVVERTAPTAIVACGDDQMTAKEWARAKLLYQQLLDLYPGQELAAKAQEGIKQATLALELANVRSLLQGSSSSQPTYCSKPAPYSAAAPYAPGNNRSLLYGGDDYAGRLPAEWKAGDVTDAVLVVCAGTKEYGTAVKTCPYENKTFRNFPTQVTFHKIAIPVKAYELRTGKLVVDTKVEIGGATCPKVLSYTTYGTFDVGPPSQVYVAEADADVNAGFRPVFAP
jgi:hypothetical protein